MPLTRSAALKVVVSRQTKRVRGQLRTIPVKAKEENLPTKKRAKIETYGEGSKPPKLEEVPVQRERVATIRSAINIKRGASTAKSKQRATSRTVGRKTEAKRTRVTIVKTETSSKRRRGGRNEPQIKREPGLKNETFSEKAKFDNEPHLRDIFVFGTDQILSIEVPQDFSLCQSICSYGFFCLAPNRWVASIDGNEDHGFFERPLRCGRVAGQELHVRIRVAQGTSQGSKRPVLLVGFDKSLLSSGRLDHMEVLAQVRRMVRADMDLTHLHSLHPLAKARGFGRTFRSPTLFEDVLKTFTLTNVTWKRTLLMNSLLCEHIGRDGAFPTAFEIANADAEDLQAKCNTGYRTPWIIAFARSVVEGEFDLASLEDGHAAMQGWARCKAGVPTPGCDLCRQQSITIFEKLQTIKGVASFAASNVLHLLGYFEKIPMDTETVRLFREDFNVTCANKDVLFAKAHAHYDAFTPFQFVAYWFDLWTNYENKHSLLAANWGPAEMYNIP